MKDVNEWAQAQFGHANLNDPRRTKRLVTVAARLANKPSAAICNSTIDIAEMEGAYRLIRNKKIDANNIADAGFIKTAQDAKDCKTLLALEDTTTLMYSHQLIEKLIETPTIICLGSYSNLLRSWAFSPHPTKKGSTASPSCISQPRPTRLSPSK